MDVEDDKPNPGISPSFDYHEERRLHLKDEIWLSHHLPRLPPAAVSDSDGNLSSSFEGSKPIPSRHIPGQINVGGASTDASPSAFHPKGASLPQAEGQWLGKNTTFPSAQGYFGTSTLSPSGPENGDLDPAPTLIHRQELDDQERLDLEEEAAERALSGMQGDLAAMHIKTQIANAQAKPPQEAGEFTPVSLSLSFARLIRKGAIQILFRSSQPHPCLYQWLTNALSKRTRSNLFLPSHSSFFILSCLLRATAAKNVQVTRRCVV